MRTSAFLLAGGLHRQLLFIAPGYKNPKLIRDIIMKARYLRSVGGVIKHREPEMVYLEGFQHSLGALTKWLSRYTNGRSMSIMFEGFTPRYQTFSKTPEKRNPMHEAKDMQHFRRLLAAYGCSDVGDLAVQLEEEWEKQKAAGAVPSKDKEKSEREKELDREFENHRGKAAAERRRVQMERLAFNDIRKALEGVRESLMPRQQNELKDDSLTGEDVVKEENQKI